jgi:hypothetical protein
MQSLQPSAFATAMAGKSSRAASLVVLVVGLGRPVDRTITHFGGEPH